MTKILLSVVLFFLLGSCANRVDRASERISDERKPVDSKGSVAFHIGEAAHAVAKESTKAAAAARKKLSKEMKEANEGWRHSEEKDRRKP